MATEFPHDALEELMVQSGISERARKRMHKNNKPPTETSAPVHGHGAPRENRTVGIEF